MGRGTIIAAVAALSWVGGATVSAAFAWEYRAVGGCRVFAVRLQNHQLVPVLDDHGHMIALGSSACAPAGEHVQFTRPTGSESVHVDGIYPATGRTWHADLRLPPDWKSAGLQPQLRRVARDRG